jgi:hypothetical protein
MNGAPTTFVVTPRDVMDSSIKCEHRDDAFTVRALGSERCRVAPPGEMCSIDVAVNSCNASLVVLDGTVGEDCCVSVSLQRQSQSRLLMPAYKLNVTVMPCENGYELLQGSKQLHVYVV